MRTTTLVLSVTVALGLALAVHAHQLGRASPHERVGGTVAGAAVSVTYGRPYMRGRKIFGGLVPYGRVWCPGADEATVLDSDRAFQIGDLHVPAGPHTIWVLPTARAWTLVVSKDESGFHTRYDPTRDLGRVPLQTRQLDSPVEQLTFEFRETSPTGGTLAMKWERTEAAVAFTIAP